MSITKRLCAALLAIVMIVSLASCYGDTTWVYEYDETRVSSGTYLAYLVNAYMVATSDEKYDSEKDIFTQQFDSVNADEYMKNEASKNIKKALFAASELKRLGKTPTKDDLSMVDMYANYYWSMYGAYYQPNGCSSESYVLMNELDYNMEALFNIMYGEGGVNEVAEDDILKYFKENFYSYNMLSVQIADSETQEALANVDEIDARFEGYEKALNEASQTFADIKVSENSATGVTSDENTDTTPSVQSEKTVISNYGQEFFDALKPLANGKAVVFNYGLNKYLIYRTLLDTYKTGDTFKNNKAAALTENWFGGYDEWLVGEAAKIELTVNSGAVSYYNPKNISLPSAG